MQPWLDMEVRDAGCRRCGCALDGADVHIWACRERTRRFDFGAARAQGGPGLIRYEAVSRAYPVCSACHAALERGAGMGRLTLVRLLAVLGGAAGLWAAGGPVVHRWAPAFIAAFYRNGVWGR